LRTASLFIDPHGTCSARVISDFSIGYGPVESSTLRSSCVWKRDSAPLSEPLVPCSSRRPRRPRRRGASAATRRDRFPPAQGPSPTAARVCHIVLALHSTEPV